jgi:hypothetical protein
LWTGEAEGCGLSGMKPGLSAHEWHARPAGTADAGGLSFFSDFSPVMNYNIASFGNMAKHLMNRE